MAKKFSVNGFIKSMIIPLCILAAITLLLVLFAGAPFYEKTLSTTSEIPRDEVKMQSQDKHDTRVMISTYQANDAGDNLAAAEESRILEEERLVEPEGTLYTEAQLKELDAETIRIVEEEIRQALEYQPAVEEEFDRGEMENSLAEEAAVLEKERLFNPEGAMYTEAQLDELDPETIRLVEKEMRLASE